MSNIRSLERSLKALANRKRLQIMQYLKKNRSASVGIIAQAIRLSFKGTSKHLRVLAGAGIVEERKRGIYVLYRLSLKQEEPVKKVLGLF